MQLLGNEKLLFADKIGKINMYGWTQERTFVISSAAVYNISKTEVKRRILLKVICGISKAAHSSEFTIHVPTEYDYRFDYKNRDHIINILKLLYWIERKENCPVYQIPSKSLKEVTTTESDMKNKHRRDPFVD